MSNMKTIYTTNPNEIKKLFIYQSQKKLNVIDVYGPSFNPFNPPKEGNWVLIVEILDESIEKVLETSKI